MPIKEKESTPAKVTATKKPTPTQQRPLESLSLRELREEEANKKKLLANGNLIEKLSDKGERIRKGLETVQKLIAQKESEEKALNHGSKPESLTNNHNGNTVPLVVLTEEQLFPSLKDQKIDLFAADTREALERKAQEELEKKQKQKELQDMLRYGKRGLANVRERKAMKMISTDEAIKLEISVQEKEKAYYEQKIQNTLKKREEKFYVQRKPTRSVLAHDEEGADEGEEEEDVFAAASYEDDEDHEGADLGEDVLLNGLRIN